MRLWERVRNLRIENALDFKSWRKAASDVFYSVGGVESLAADKELNAGDSGKTFILNLAAGFTVDLPAPESGLRFKFIVGTAPADGDYVIDANDDIMVVGVDELAASTVGPRSASATTITFVEDTAVVGDFVELISDGTNWYGTGQTNADGGVTLA